MPLYYCNNSLGVNFLRVVYKFGYLQAVYLFIIRQTTECRLCSKWNKIESKYGFWDIQRQDNPKKDNPEMKYKVKFTIDFILCTNIQIPEFTENMLAGMRKEGGGGWQKWRKWRNGNLTHWKSGGELGMLYL